MLSNSFFASPKFFHLQIAFANSLDPDQNIGPDLDPNMFEILIVFLKKWILKQVSRRQKKKKKKEKITQHAKS